MKRLRITATLVAALAVLSAGRANAQATTTVNFNDGTAFDPIDTFYQALGVTFANAAWSSVVVPNSIGSDGLKLMSYDEFFMPSAGDPIIAIFSQAIASASIAALDVGGNGVRINAFDAAIGGNLIASTQLFGTGAGDGNNQILSVSGAGIRRIELYQPLSADQDGIAFDNLMFTTQAVTATPEPASLALCLTGLVGVGAWTRRRRKNRVDAD